MLGLCQWLQSTGFATYVRESLNLYPALYTLHIFGFVIMVTATSALDLRVLGWALRESPVPGVYRRAIPWAKAGLAANLTTGFIVFAAQAVDMVTNTAFLLKMLMVLLAGVNIFVVKETAYKTVDQWGEKGEAPFAAKASAVISILLWFGIVAASRVIGFTGSRE